MIPRSLLPFGLLVLLSACVQPEPQAYMPPYTPPYVPPEPYFPPPRPVARPLPLLVPAPEDVVVPDALQPLLPPTPSDSVDVPSTAFFPVDTGPAPVPEPAPPPPVPKPVAAEPAGAVPFMGFRPMKGQTKALP